MFWADRTVVKKVAQKEMHLFLWGFLLFFVMGCSGFNKGVNKTRSGSLALDEIDFNKTTQFINSMNQRAFSVYGSCKEEAAQVVFSVDSVVLGEAQCRGDHFFTNLNFESIDDGRVVLTVTFEGESSSVSNNITLTKDTVAPSLSQITGENDNKIDPNNRSRYSISGLCSENLSEVAIVDQYGVLAATTCENRRFQLDIDFKDFKDGLVNIQARAKDWFRNSSLYDIGLVKDTVAPVISSIRGENSNFVNQYNQASYTISGDCDDSKGVISLFLDSQNLAVVECDGTRFETTLDLSFLEDDVFAFNVQIEDDFGNMSSKNLYLVKDTQIISISSMSSENNNRINQNNQESYTISGSCEEKDSQITFTVGALTQMVLCDGSMFEVEFNFSPPQTSFSGFGILSNPIPDGNLVMTVSVQDPAGNTLETSMLLDKDTVAPTLSSMSGEHRSYVNLQNQASYKVSGSCDDNEAIISFQSGSKNLGSTVCQNHRFEMNLDLTSFEDQSMAVTAQIKDDFENFTSSDILLVKDTSVPVLSHIRGSNGQKVNFFNQESYSVSGNCNEKEATILFMMGTEILSNTVCDGREFQSDLVLSSFGDGPLEMTLKIEDRAGNVGTESFSLMKETVRPAISLAPSDSHIINLQNQNGYEISGSCDDATATVSFITGSQTIKTTPCDGANFQANLDFQSVDEGSVTLTIQIKDDFGNANSEELSLIKDTVVPSLSSVTGSHNNKVNSLNQNAYRISGDCDDATATISFSVASQSLGSVVCDGTDFQKDLDLQSLSDGDMTLTLSIEDGYGNGGFQELSLTKDTTVPSLLSLRGLNNNKVNVSNQSAYRVSGSCDDAAATISFSVGSRSLGRVACDGTSFEKALNLQPLKDGAVTLTLRIEDDFGNESSQNLSLTKDTIVPSLSSLSGLNNNEVNFSNQNAYRISGSCDDRTAHLSLSSGSQDLGVATVMAQVFKEMWIFGLLMMALLLSPLALKIVWEIEVLKLFF